MRGFLILIIVFVAAAIGLGMISGSLPKSIGIPVVIVLFLIEMVVLSWETKPKYEAKIVSFANPREKTEYQLQQKEGRSIRIHWVEGKHRTHPWSKRPGGCTVIVLYGAGQCRGYDRVKRPHRYILKVSKDFISNLNSGKRSKNVKEYIDKIYAKSSDDSALDLVWTRYISSDNPWKLLEKYAIE